MPLFTPVHNHTLPCDILLCHFMSATQLVECNEKTVCISDTSRVLLKVTKQI